MLKKRKFTLVFSISTAQKRTFNFQKSVMQCRSPEGHQDDVSEAKNPYDYRRDPSLRSGNHARVSHKTEGINPI